MGEGTAKLIEGADLDVVLQEPLKKTMEMMEEKAQESRSKHQPFRSTTLKDSTLLVEEIKNFKDHLDQPREEIAKLIQEKEGDKLVGKSLKMEVLKDGASTLELMGLPRSGKAVLVRKFGSDDQVKESPSSLVDNSCRSHQWRVIHPLLLVPVLQNRGFTTVVPYLNIGTNSCVNNNSKLSDGLLFW